MSVRQRDFPFHLSHLLLGGEGWPRCGHGDPTAALALALGPAAAGLEARMAPRYVRYTSDLLVGGTLGPTAQHSPDRYCGGVQAWVQTGESGECWSRHRGP